MTSLADPSATLSPADPTPSPATPRPTESRRRSNVQLRAATYAQGAVMLSPRSTSGPVQMAGGGGAAAGVHALAEQGVAGEGGSVPYLATIQAAFGRHSPTARPPSRRCGPPWTPS